LIFKHSRAPKRSWKIFQWGSWKVLGKVLDFFVSKWVGTLLLLLMTQVHLQNGSWNGVCVCVCVCVWSLELESAGCSSSMHDVTDAPASKQQMPVDAGSATGLSSFVHCVNKSWSNISVYSAVVKWILLFSLIILRGAYVKFHFDIVVAISDYCTCMLLTLFTCVMVVVDGSFNAPQPKPPNRLSRVIRKNNTVPHKDVPFRS